MKKLHALADIQASHHSDGGARLRCYRDGIYFVIMTEAPSIWQLRIAQLVQKQRLDLVDAIRAVQDNGGKRYIDIDNGRIQVLATNRGEPFAEGVEIALMLPEDQYADDAVFLDKRDSNELIRVLKAG